MNKGIIGLGIGAVVGTVATFLIMRDKYNKIINELNAVSNELDEVYKEMKNMSGELDDITKNAKDILENGTLAEEETSAVLEKQRTYSKLASKYKTDNKNDDINPAYSEARIDSDEDENYKYEQMSKNSNEPRYTTPYVISFNEFNEGNEHYDKINLYFYEDDEVLTEDNQEEVVCDSVKYIGDVALESFGEESGDPEIVYIRNEMLEIDYEVIRLSKSYAKTVLGYDNEQG